MLAKALSGATAAAEKLYIEDTFSTFLYTGNGSTQTITNGIDLSGEGGAVWVKNRTSANAPIISNTDRGLAKILQTSSTAAETDNTSVWTYTPSSAGWSITASGGFINGSGENYASWTFRKAAKFFDVVTYTGTGSGTTQAINHSLGTTPGLIIIKRVDGASPWIIWHRSLTSTYYLQFSTAAANDSSNTDYFGNNVTTVEPTSTTFTVGQASAVNSGDMIAYLFAHDAGGFGDSGNDSVVKCGSFTQASGGTTIDLGWEPQWVLIKTSSTAGNWFVFDNMRGNTVTLFPNLSNAETDQGADAFKYNANGFTLADFVTGSVGSTIIYIAIRRGPMKTPTDATKVFLAATATQSSGTSRGIDFVSDMYINSCRTSSATGHVQTRLTGFAADASTGSPSLLTPYTQSENAVYSPSFYDIWNSTYKDGAYLSGLSNVWYHFGRAPGFFDVVALTGTNSATAYSHNLGVTPEMIIVKKRNGTSDWLVYQAGYPTPTTNQGALNLSGGSYANSNFPTAPTSTQFTLHVFDTGTYISYLFASCPGVSKVGSYTGTGTTLDVNCGFTNGARFVLIKRTDSTGDWFFWDTARGIVSGNDSYLRFNVDAAEVTGNDYIDPLSSGFQISSTAPAAINANGGSFIFLAIA